MSYNTGFAEVYDKIISRQVDFSDYCEKMLDYCQKYSCKVKSALDLGCGSGLFTEQLCSRGIEVCGVDLSEDMLTLAQKRLEKYSTSLICDDMTDLCLERRFDAVFCTLDGLNHLCNINAFKAAVKSANRALNKNGIFIFDVNTVYKHNEVLKNNTFIFDDENYYLVWQNFLCKNDKVEIMLDSFIGNDGKIRRYSDDFSERAYSDEVICDVLRENGFGVLKKLDFESFGRIRPKSEKIVYIARKGR